MPVSIALNLVSFVDQPGVQHLPEFLLYSPTYIVEGAEGIFLVAVLWIVQVGFLEAMFIIQQLLECVAVFVKPILVLSGRWPQVLFSGVVDQLSEGRPVCLHILTVQGVESRRSSRVSSKTVWGRCSSVW